MTDTLTAHTADTHLGEDGIRDFLRDIGHHPLLTAQQELDLAKRCAVGDEEAIRKLVVSNLRLVVSVAREYAGKGVPLMDLIQEGSIGLVEAAKKFDYKRQTRFSTYAVSWIHQGVIQCLVRQKNMIRVPSYTMERVRKVMLAKAQLQQAGQAEPTVQAIAAACGLSVDKTEKYLQLDLQTISLDAAVQSEQDTTLVSMVPDTLSADPQEQVVRDELKNTMEQLLSMLDSRQQQVLRLHFGLDGDGCSLEEISVRFGVSKERIRQIERQAITKLQKMGASLGLEEFLNE